MAENKTPQQNANAQSGASGTEVESLRAELAKAKAEKDQAEAKAAKAEEEAAAALAAKEQALKDAQAQAEASAHKEEAAAARQLRGQKKIWPTINSTPDDSTAVMVGVNGYTYRIKRDRRALVPEAVGEVLKLSAMDVPVVERLPNGQNRTTFKHVNRFSFSVEPAEPGAVAEDD